MAAPAAGLVQVSNELELSNELKRISSSGGFSHSRTPAHQQVRWLPPSLADVPKADGLSPAGRLLITPTQVSRSPLLGAMFRRPPPRGLPQLVESAIGNLTGLAFQKRWTTLTLSCSVRVTPYSSSSSPPSSCS